MTLQQLIHIIKKDFPKANSADICRVVNELEYRISKEILKPAGLPYREQLLLEKTDLNTPLLIGEQYLVIYTSYISAFISMLESDWERANALSEIFNQKYSELATEIRKSHIPVTKTAIKGGWLS